MKQTFLDFEQPIAELQAKIDELRYVHEDSAVDISDEIGRLQKKSQQLTKDIYSKLTSWQIAQVARHPQRPYTLDYINGLFADFRELHGDRSYGDDPAIVGVLPVAVQLAEIAEEAVDVVERVGTLRMARDHRDLPCRQLAVDFLGELLALLLQTRDLVRDVDGRILVHVAQLVDLGLQLGDRLLEIEESLFHGRHGDIDGAHLNASARKCATAPVAYAGRSMSTCAMSSSWYGGPAV